MKFDDSFQNYSSRIEKAVDEIPANEIIKTKRKGLASFRDKFVFIKTAWTEANGYFSVLQAIIIFMALIPAAISNVNLLFKPFGFEFPVVISSFMAFIFVIFVFLFGFLSYRFFGTAKRSAEIGAKLSSCDFVEWKDLQEIKQGIIDIKKDLEVLKK